MTNMACCFWRGCDYLWRLQERERREGERTTRERGERAREERSRAGSRYTTARTSLSTHVHRGQRNTRWGARGRNMAVRLTVAAARSCELRERFVYSLACCTKREGVCALRFTARWFANVLLAKVERTGFERNSQLCPKILKEHRSRDPSIVGLRASEKEDAPRRGRPSFSLVDLLIPSRSRVLCSFRFFWQLVHSM